MDNNILDSNVSENGLTITPQIKGFLKETAKWAKFISIVGFVMTGIMVLAGVFMGTFMGAAGLSESELGPMAMMGGGFITIIYIVIAVIYIFPLLYLYRFSTKIKVAINQEDQMYLTEAFKNLKSLYKFMGVFMAIIIGFYAIFFVFALLGGMAAMF